MIPGWLRNHDHEWIDPKHGDSALAAGCSTPLGYCYHLSCLAGNLFPRTYAWLLVYAVVLALIMPGFLVLGDTRNWELTRHGTGYIQARHLFLVSLMFHLGVPLLIVTAVSPWTYHGHLYMYAHKNTRGVP